MNASPLLFDDNKELVSFRLRKGPHDGTRFAVTTRVCHSPVCGCTTLHFVCSPEDAPLNTRRFALDVQNRLIVSSQWDQHAVEDEDLAKDLIAEMTVDDWATLLTRYVEVKQSLMETADWTQYSIQFPDEVLDDPTVMVAAGEVLPWRPPYDFEADGELWIADDQYCVNPECTCKDVGISFLHIEQNSNYSMRTAGVMPRATMNTRNGTITPVAPPWRATPSLETLAQCFRKKHPNAHKDFKHYRTLLRMKFREAHFKEMLNHRSGNPLSGDLFGGDEETIRSSVDQQFAPPVAQSPNDPCPCGSAKKYKKCCGRMA